MANRALPLLLTVICITDTAFSDEPSYRDNYPDTWVGTDALDRTMPLLAEAGTVKKDKRRVVEIFYIARHRDRAAVSLIKSSDGQGF